jgi:hypothetical protein
MRFIGEAANEAVPRQCEDTLDVPAGGDKRFHHEGWNR